MEESGGGSRQDVIRVSHRRWRHIYVRHPLPPTSTMFPAPSTVHTPGFAHYSIAWSPFHANRLALASAANFGLIGNGRVHLISLTPQNPPQPSAPGGSLPGLQIDKFFPTQDGLYDVSWSEIHENQLVTASGDGSLRLWDVTFNVRSSVPCSFCDW